MRYVTASLLNRDYIKSPQTNCWTGRRLTEAKQVSSMAGYHAGMLEYENQVTGVHSKVRDGV